MKYIFSKILNVKMYSWLRWNYHNFGLFSIFKSFFLYLLYYNKHAKVDIINTNNFINIRPGTTDQDVYNEFFKYNELDIAFDDPKIIVDGGAHIGCASISLTLKFPNSKIYAIEPDENNYEVLLSNSKYYPNITPLRYGLWDKKAFLQINSKNKDNWNFTVNEIDFNDGLEAIGISDLMKIYNIEKIDILKIDIEGSEIELFKNPDWLNNVECIIIELHDRFREDCSKTFFDAINTRKYVKEQKGEKVFVRFVN